MSARDLSLSLGQNASYINRIENKINFPSMQAFFYICEYLNITPGSFFDSETDNPEQLQQLIQKMKKLSDEQLASIENLVDGIVR